MRAHGVALVATVWLILLIAGSDPALTTAAGLPCMAVALVAYISELKERFHR